MNGFRFLQLCREEGGGGEEGRGRGGANPVR